jgi:hypothetical protein
MSCWERTARPRRRRGSRRSRERRPIRCRRTGIRSGRCSRPWRSSRSRNRAEKAIVDCTRGPPRKRNLRCTAGACSGHRFRKPHLPRTTCSCTARRKRFRTGRRDRPRCCGCNRCRRNTGVGCSGTRPRSHERSRHRPGSPPGFGTFGFPSVRALLPGKCSVGRNRSHHLRPRCLRSRWEGRQCRLRFPLPQSLRFRNLRRRLLQPRRIRRPERRRFRSFPRPRPMHLRTSDFRSIQKRRRPRIPRLIRHQRRSAPFRLRSPSCNQRTRIREAAQSQSGVSKFV